MRIGVTRFVATASVVILGATAAAQQSITYPATRKIEHLDTYHGVQVADPYRWLEEDARKSTEVADWVEAQNKVTFTYLNSIPERSIIKERLTNLWNYEKLTAPLLPVTPKTKSRLSQTAATPSQPRKQRTPSLLDQTPPLV